MRWHALVIVLASGTANADSVKQLVQQLADARQDVRDAAAAKLRAIKIKPVDWKARLAKLPKQISQDKFAELTGATMLGGGSSGGGASMLYQLDDSSVVEAYFDDPGGLREIGPVEHRARAVWVEPPKDFTGHWITYFANGVIDHDTEYSHGTYVDMKDYYDNGQLVFEQRYVDGKIDGDEIGFHPSGAKAYEAHHAKGKNVGHWVHWYPSGKLQSEATYVDGALDGVQTNYRENGTKEVQFDYKAGKEQGQAAWDEHGKLEYAHGSLAKLAKH